MNQLDVCIEKIHNVQVFNDDWGSYVLVDMTINCYGDKRRITKSFSSWEEWKQAKELGYYQDWY